MAEDISIEELTEKIKQANKNYYLLGESDLSDAEYDSLVEQLRKLDPKNPILNKVGDDSEAENKVKLPVIMGSLNKTRPDEADLIKLYGKNDLVKTPKLDGLSMLIEYENGRFKTLYTRGNGFEGQDITGRAKYMNFPKNLKEEITDGTVYVIGEAVISRENFKQMKGIYKHPRNAVGGTLRPILTNKEYEEVPQDIKDNCKLVDIVVYGLISDSYNFKLFTDSLKVLQKNDFIVADFEVINCVNITPSYMSRSIKSFRSNYKYLTDGMVLRLNDNNLFNTLGKEANGLNPRGSRAIKANLEDQFSQIGVIDHIDWEISKRGNFIPVIILKEPVLFDGAEVTRISGNNVKYVRENHWASGVKVKLVRSGDVIPRIIAQNSDGTEDLKIPAVCPWCGEPLQENEAHLYCPNPCCVGKTRAGVIEFFVNANLEDVSYQTVAYLYDSGFNTHEKLLTIRYNQLIAMEGFQAKKAIAVERELNNCLKGITLAKFMYLSQCFMNEKSSLGETKLQWVIDAYGEEAILASLNNEKDENGNFKKLDPTILNNIKGFAETSINLFKNNWRDFKLLYQRLKPFIEFKQPEIVSNKLSGMSFAFTGFRDSSLEELITKNGGSVKGVSKKTSVLFAASADSTKTKTATAYGIPIVAAPLAKEYIEKLLS